MSCGFILLIVAVAQCDIAFGQIPYRNVQIRAAATDARCKFNGSFMRRTQHPGFCKFRAEPEPGRLCLIRRAFE